MPNVIESYLISLGFDVSAPAYRKFEGALKDSSNLVEHAAKSTGWELGKFAGDIVKFQGAILTGFTSISAAVIGVGVNAAKQDQSFRLLGMHMFTTTENARKMQMITDALGESWEDIIWDKELHARAITIGSHIDRLTKQLGPNYEANMKGIRDLITQFDILKVDVKFLGMEFASSLFTKLGLKDTDISQWIDKLEKDLPNIADKLATNVVPILHDTWDMLKSAGGALKEFGVLFQNVVGQLSGDKAIQGTTLNFETMATAIHHVLEALSVAFEKIITGETQLSHITKGVILFSERKFVAAKDEFDAADEPNRLQAARDAAAAAEAKRPGSTPASIALASAGAVLPAPPAPGTTPRKLDPNKPINFWDLEQGDWGYRTFRSIPAISLLGGLNPSAIAGWIERHAKQGSRWADTSNLAKPESSSGISLLADLQHHLRNQRELVDQAITVIATRMGIDPRIARAQAKQESGEQQYDRFGNVKRGRAGEIGIMQLKPSTAADMGVDPTDPLQNIIGGLQYFRQLLAKYHNDLKLALEAYNWGPGALDAALKNHTAIPDIREQYARGIMQNAGAWGSYVPATTVDVGGITIHIEQPNASADDIHAKVASAVTSGITNAMNKQTQRTLAQMSSR
ncbi:MAG TPA: lytic transglycosylase domain-containing protein [Bryobacteraceae bacterium]|jgi:soluble lytic murein transglycosylase-like protein|nr:lytic transglycosylase domain-containing protein [Bryobacteraceae bacterium]